MKIFISWSGTRSRYVADTLRHWLPKVIQATKPWMSEEDIATGSRWSAEISGQLEQTKVGIICLTPENQHNPWIMFEAGALSKVFAQSYVCPYLIDMSPSQVSGPMAQFQSAASNREGTLRILQTLNRALEDSQLPAPELEEVFDVWWPKLETQMSALPDPESETIAIRSPEDILEEIVQNTREQLRREGIRLAGFQEREIKLDAFLDNYEMTVASMTKMMSPSGFGSAIKMLTGMDRQREGEGLPGIGESGPGVISSALPQLVTDLRDLQQTNKEETQRLLNSENKESG